MISSVNTCSRFKSNTLSHIHTYTHTHTHTHTRTHTHTHAHTHTHTNTHTHTHTQTDLVLLCLWCVGRRMPPEQVDIVGVPIQTADLWGAATLLACTLDRPDYAKGIATMESLAFSRQRLAASNPMAKGDGDEAGQNEMKENSWHWDPCFPARHRQWRGATRQSHHSL
jgi:hypothetical protein